MTDAVLETPSPWQRLLPHRKVFGLALIPLVLFTWLWPMLPTEDLPGYLNFAAPFGDVLSNLAFLVVGLIGLARLRNAQLPQAIRALVVSLALSSILTALGSSYFHLSPSEETLFWDRLPMALGFSAVVGLVIADRISHQIGIRAFCTLAAAGLTSLVLWQKDIADLRPYILLQYGGLAFTIVTASLTKPKTVPNAPIFAGLALYFLAKILELGDAAVFKATGGLVSGHTLKHLFAALALLKILEVTKWNPAR